MTSLNWLIIRVAGGVPTVKSCVQYIREDPFLATILPYICMIKFTSKLIANMGSSKMTGFKKDTKQDKK